MRLLAFLLLLSTAAHADDYLFAEVGQYKSLGTNDWLGDYPIRFTAGYEWTNGKAYVRIEASHMSNIDQGPPFSANMRETYLDTAGVTVGWRFRLR